MPLPAGESREKEPSGVASASDQAPSASTIARAIVEKGDQPSLSQRGDAEHDSARTGYSSVMNCLGSRYSDTGTNGIIWIACTRYAAGPNHVWYCARFCQRMPTMWCSCISSG